MSLRRKFYGDDYANKMEKFNDAIQFLKETYRGDYDTSARMYTIQPEISTGNVSFQVDYDVPKDLSKELHRIFNEIWG